MKIRVLMIGAGLEIPGGISALAKTLLPVLEQQVDLRYLPTVEQRALAASGKVSLRNMAAAVSQYARFLVVLCRFRPRIVHLHTSQGIAWLKDTFYVLVGKALRCRVVVHVHAADFGRLYGGRPRLQQRYTRWAMGLADAVIAVSAEWRDRLGAIVPIDRVHTFRNCVDVSDFPARPTAGAEAKALFLGSVGQRKGVFDLLEAMRHLQSRGRSLHLWIAGAGEREGEFAAASARLKALHLEERCELVGAVRGARKMQLLAEAGLFVLPSYQEGLPMAMLEAMAAGMAVVATPVGGIPEFIRDGFNGFLVGPGDVQTLADRLAVLAADRDLREAMGRRNREIAEQELDVVPYVKRLAALYESLDGAR